MYSNGCHISLFAVMNSIMLNVLTQGMDPITRAVMKSTLGPELLDMDGGTGGGGTGSSYGMGGAGGAGGMEGLMGGISNYIIQSMFSPPQWSPAPSAVNPPPVSQPTFTTTNIVAPSAKNPSKGLNLVNPYNAAPFAVSPSSVSSSMLSPAAPMPAPTSSTSTSISSPANTALSQTSFSRGTMGLGMSNPAPRRTSFFRQYMMMRFMQMMDFF